jgi:hypothetical protein
MSIYVTYINLDKDNERRKHIEEQLKLVFDNTEIVRFSAIPHIHGLIGCGKGHIQCIKNFINSKADYGFIFEDDFEIINRDTYIYKINSFLSLNLNWDVLIIGGNNFRPFDIINNDVIKIKNCQTTTSYIVKKSYYDTLINNFKTGLNNLNKANNSCFCIDMFWKQLQHRDNWYYLTPTQIVQKRSFSNIENRVVDYKSGMINYKK